MKPSMSSDSFISDGISYLLEIIGTSCLISSIFRNSNFSIWKSCKNWKIAYILIRPFLF